MRKIIITLVFVLALILYGQYYIKNHAFPHTLIARVNVSGESKQTVEHSLITALTIPLSIRIKNRVYQYRYSDIGINMNLETAIANTFEPNQKPFPKNLKHFLQGIHSYTLILPALSFNQDYYHFISDSIFDFSKKNDEVSVDNTAKRLIYQEHEEKYTIDPQSLKTQIIMNFGKQTVLEPKLVRVKNRSIAKVLGMNTVLTHVFDTPIRIELKDIANSPRFTIPPDQLKQLLNIHYDEESNHLGIDIVANNMQTLISNIHDYLKLDPDKKIDEISLKEDLTGLINSRAQNQSVDTITAKTHFTPNTSGSLAKKYIEVDISQQTMYLFSEGALYHTYKISTGLYYPTPVGHFKIMNKAVNAYSDIYHVWMPYWMAFYYGPEVDAYFGIHELPYWVTDDGKKIHRPSEFIGSPHTGGCVALDIGAAKEVYAFADVGMPVYVYN